LSHIINLFIVTNVTLSLRIQQGFTLGISPYICLAWFILTDLTDDLKVITFGYQSNESLKVDSLFLI
jgi:hypothetical protein